MHTWKITPAKLRNVVYQSVFLVRRGEQQNREEGEMAQKKLGGGRNRAKKKGGGRKCEVNVKGAGRN